MKKELCIAAIIVVSLSGCAGNPVATRAINSANAQLAASYSPYRYKAHQKSSRTIVAVAEWAGSPGPSITNSSTVLKADLESHIQTTCGFSPEQRVETRSVSIQPPIIHEVWLYRDSQSEHPDKVSGISVMLKQLPNNGGVDFGISEPCHSKKQPEFVFSS